MTERTVASPREKRKAKLELDQLQWIEEYTQQARDHVQGLRDDPNFPPAPADAGIEGGEITIESEADYMWPPHE
jgi:hypothetical protein